MLYPGAWLLGLDTFTYTVANNFGSVSAPGTISIFVAKAPTTVNDTATVPAGSSSIISMSANDIAGTSPLNLASVVIVSPLPVNGSCGTLLNNLDGDVRYTAPLTVPAIVPPATTATCSFSYTISDISLPALISNAATVTVTITAPVAPTTVNDTFPNATVPALITAFAPVTLNVLANDTATAPSAINPASVAVSVPAGNGSASVNAVTGIVTYTPPAAAGIYTFTYTVKDNFTTPAISNVATVTVTVSAAPAAPLTITTINPITKYPLVAVPYVNAILPQGGTAPYTRTLSAGSLPPGITFFPATGDIFGVPTTAGTFTFTFTVTDSLAVTTSKSYTLVITPPLVLTTINPITTFTRSGGNPYVNAILPTGGTAPYTLNLAGGSLPPGISFFPATGDIFGVPTTAGSFTFTIQAVDGIGSSNTQTYTLGIL